MTDRPFDQRVGWGTEQSLAATSFNSTTQNIGSPLPDAGTIIIFDNQTDVSVPIIVNGATWKTFSAGEALILDLSTNRGNAPDRTADIGIQFQTNASAGLTGSFRISFNYAR